MPMPYTVLADLVVLLHVGFVVFAVFGGLLALHSPRWVYVHVPAAAWAVLVEWTGWICPLTPLENFLRMQGAGSGYHGSFIEQYVLPLLYPASLTRPLQVVLGVLVVLINVGIYGWVWYRMAGRARAAR